jgi:hypothetical protein
MLLISNIIVQKIILETKSFLQTIYLTKFTIIDLLKNILTKLFIKVARKLLFAFDKYV